MFPKTLKELQDYIVAIWRSSIDSLSKRLGSTTIRVDVVEDDITALDEVVTENTEEILATKVEVQEVKQLIGLLVFELIEQGVKIESEQLLQLVELVNELEEI